jgi:hypothetical protein
MKTFVVSAFWLLIRNTSSSQILSSQKTNGGNSDLTDKSLIINPTKTIKIEVNKWYSLIFRLIVD